MASLSRGVTVALLGIFLLGAARLPRGAGECGAEGALSAEGRGCPPAGAWWRGARVAEGAGRGAGGAVGGPRDCPAPQAGGRGGRALWIPRHLAQDAGLAWHAGSPAVGRRIRAPRGKEEGRAEAGPGDLARRRAARSGALPGLLVAPGGLVRGKLPCRVHPLTSAPGQRRGEETVV